jgi:hypothetical protein
VRRTWVELHEQVAKVNSKQELADFVAGLHHDLTTQRDQWENPTLERYLEAMEAWIRDAEQLQVTGPACRSFAEILYAAKVYE